MPQPQVHKIATCNATSTSRVTDNMAYATPTTSPTSMEDLARRLDQLTREVASLKTFRSRPRSRSREHRGHWRQRSKSRSHNPPQNGQYWFHATFKSRATKCRPPCNYAEGNKKDSH